MAWRLYYISLLPLFGFIVIKYFEPSSFVRLCHAEWSNIKCEHWAFMGSVVLGLFAILSIIPLAIQSKFGYNISGAKILSKPDSLNHEMIGVLATVVLPFLTVNFTTIRECSASIFVIIIIGLIATRSNLYYKNPVLAILNFKIYKVVVEHTDPTEPKEFDVITLKTLKKDDSLYLKKIGEGVFYAKKV